MLNFSNVFVAFVIFGISVGLPIKDEEIDELIYRLQDLKHQNLYDDHENEMNTNEKSHLHRAIDLERKPLLYDYYANTLNPIYHKRNFDEIDRSSLTGFKRNFDEIDRSSLSGFHTKRNFDEIDRSSLSGFKRNFDEIDRTGLTGFHSKRNFDEIDRSSLSGFKRNFDEIDRSALSSLIHRKRYIEPHTIIPAGLLFNEVDRSGFTDFMKRYYNDDRINTGSGNTGKITIPPQMYGDERFGNGDHNKMFVKKNFDEIDRSALNGLKRTVRKATNDEPTKEAEHTKYSKD